VAALGLGVHGLVVAKTIRRRLITLPGRLTHTARAPPLAPPVPLAVGRGLPHRPDPPARTPAANL